MAHFLRYDLDVNMCLNLILYRCHPRGVCKTDDHVILCRGSYSYRKGYAVHEMRIRFGVARSVVQDHRDPCRMP